MGCIAGFKPTNRGVLQGSILGPILFAICVGDVACGLGVGVKHMMYADDLQVYVHSRSDDLGSALDVTKTQAIVFGSAPYVNRTRDDFPVVRIHQTILPLQESVRCL